MDNSSQSSCQNKFDAMLDQINGYITAVSHYVKTNLMLCWTRLMDNNCQSSCQNKFDAMLDQINA